EMKQLAKRLMKNPATMCEAIRAGSLPERAGERLTEAQQAKFIHGAGGYCREHAPQAKGEGTISTSDVKQCADEACFQARFAECKRTTYTTANRMGGKAEFAIEGSADKGCRVRMT